MVSSALFPYLIFKLNIDIHLAPFLYHWVNDYIDTSSQHAKTKPQIKDDHADPRHWSPTEDKSDNLNIQRTRYVLSLWWICLWQIIHWPAGDSMRYYICSLANTFSQRAEKVMCVWYSTGSTTAQFLYQRTIVVISVSLTTHYMEGKILRYCERTSANTAPFQDSVQCAELQTTP